MLLTALVVGRRVVVVGFLVVVVGFLVVVAGAFAAGALTIFSILNGSAAQNSDLVLTTVTLKFKSVS